MVDSGAYGLSYDAENRLKKVEKNNSLIASYTYDADGVLVKRWDGQTAVYIGELYEKNLNTGQVTCRGQAFPRAWFDGDAPWGRLSFLGNAGWRRECLAPT